MVTTTLTVGTFLRSRFEIHGRKRLYQVTKISDTAIFVKIIGEGSIATNLRIETEAEVFNSFYLDN